MGFLVMKGLMEWCYFVVVVVIVVAVVLFGWRTDQIT